MPFRGVVMNSFSNVKLFTYVFCCKYNCNFPSSAFVVIGSFSTSLFYNFVITLLSLLLLVLFVIIFVNVFNCFSAKYL
jgi:hypothetical protein